MHVAHFIQRYPPALGGSEAYFARLSRWRRDQGDAVSIWTSTAVDLSAFWAEGGRRMRPGISRDEQLTIRRYEPSNWFARRQTLKLLSFFPHAAWQCATMTCNPLSIRMGLDVLRDEGPCDLVHASAFPYTWPLLCGLRLARRKKAPFLLTPFLHLGDPDDPRDRTRQVYTSRPMRYLLQAADTVFAQTEVERDAIHDLGVPADRLVLQGLGVDSGDCTGGDRVRVRESWQVDERDCVIGHLANLSHPKGTIDLLRAAKIAWEDGARFRIVLAGPAMPDFNRFWRSFEPKERVQLLGPLSEDQKRDFFAGIDAFCLPSRSDSFGLVLLEAWANGKPVIAYRSGGVGDLIQHGDDGLLIRCGDFTGLASALSEMERNGERRVALGAVGKKRTEWEFRWEDKLRVVDEVMARVVKGEVKVGV